MINHVEVIIKTPRCGYNCKTANTVDVLIKEMLIFKRRTSVDKFLVITNVMQSELVTLILKEPT